MTTSKVSVIDFLFIPTVRAVMSSLVHDHEQGQCSTSYSFQQCGPSCRRWCMTTSKVSVIDFLFIPTVRAVMSSLVHDHEQGQCHRLLVHSNRAGRHVVAGA